MQIKGTIRIDGVDIAVKAMQEFREQAVFKADCSEEYKNGFNEAFDGMLLVLMGLQDKEKFQKYCDEHPIEIKRSD